MTEIIPGWLIVAIILGFVFLLNYVLIREGIRSRGSSNPLSKKSFRDLLIPWDQESRDLDELRMRINSLEEPTDDRQDDE